MAAAPKPENPEVQTADEIIHIAIYDLAVDGAVTSLETQYPILANPFIDKFLRMLMKLFARRIYKVLSRFVTFQIIDVQTWADKKAYAQAEENLRKVHLNGSPDEIAKAKADFKNALASVIHYNRN